MPEPVAAQHHHHIHLPLHPIPFQTPHTVPAGKVYLFLLQLVIVFYRYQFFLFSLTPTTINCTLLCVFSIVQFDKISSLSSLFEICFFHFTCFILSCTGGGCSSNFMSCSKYSIISWGLFLLVAIWVQTWLQGLDV